MEHVDPKTLTIDPRALRGRKGGGKKGGGGGGKESKNTLRSVARARILELVSEGVYGGLVDGLKSVYFDNTPVMNADGSLNYEGVTFEERKGLPDQQHFGNVKQVETPFEVDVQVKANQAPVSRTIIEQNADAVRVVVRIPALSTTDDKGNIKGTNLSYAVEVQASGGPWLTAETVNLQKQKCTSPYERATYAKLPVGGWPWNVRVRRITADSEELKLQNSTYFAGYAVLVEGKYTYPNSGLVYLECDAEKFGNQMPTRYFRVNGIEVDVPTNYDPINRIYSGIWDGTFKRATCSCPAWTLYDILQEDRYGLGEFIDTAKIDKWNLYAIGKYCDEKIPSGFKDVNGDDIMESRFTFRGVINSRDDAFKLLQDITVAFRGMAFWSLGQVFAVADMPTDAKKIVTPANVVDGTFTYNSTALKARHSVALVSWNDPDDMFKRAVEVVIDDEALRKWGWREVEVQPVGCASRGQAHRFGRWILDTEQNETETVEYEAGDDHNDLRPGDVIKVADPRKAAYRIGGRITAAGPTVITLDQKFTPTPGATYQLHAELPDGKLETRDVVSFFTPGQTPAAPGPMPTIDSTALRVNNTIIKVDGSGVPGGSPAIPGAYASGQITVTVQTNAAGQHIVINGLGLFSTTSPTESFHFLKGTGTTGTATNLAAFINENPNGLLELANLSATSSGSVVTLTDKRMGVIGNSNTLGTQGAVRYTVSGPTFVGGVDPVAAVPATPSSDGDPDALTVVTITAPFSASPQVEALWAVTGTDAAPRHFKVLGVTETDDGRFKINALFHDPQKYLRVERQMSFDPIQYTRPVALIRPPANLLVQENLYYRDAGPTSRIIVSWSPSDDFQAAGYNVSADTPNGFMDYGMVRGNTLDIEDVDQGEWTFYVRSVGHTNLVSAPVSESIITQGWSGSAAPTVSGLVLKNAVNNATTFQTREPEFAWTNVFPGVDSAVMGLANPFFDCNLVRVFDTTTNALLREEEISGPAYVYTFAKNQADNAAAGRAPARAVRIEVAVRDVFMRVSAYITLAVSNPPPAAVAPTTVPGYDAFFLKWVNPQDLDFDGAIVWVSTTQGFTPGPANLYSDGRFSTTTVDAEAGTTYYARVAAYDAFSKDGLNISGEITCVSAQSTFDTVAPNTPTGLSVASSVASDGSARVIATWNANTENDLASYDIELSLGASTTDWVAFSTGLTRYEWFLPTNQAFRFRLRARDTFQNRSGYTALVSHTTARDLTAPSTPVTLVARPGFKAIWLSWAQVTAADLATYEIYESDTTTAPVTGTTATFVARTNGFTRSDLENGVTKNYWVRAVDSSGNKSGWSSIASATTLVIGSTDVALENLANGLAVLEDAWIESANIIELDASKIKVGSLLAGGILVQQSGGGAPVPLEDLASSGGGDPAEVINAGSTLIEAGKIKISSGTLLSSWIGGPNSTEINGGKIAANTILANVLEIGARGVTVEDIEFSYDKATNKLYWTAGRIRYMRDDGVQGYVAVSANTTGATWTTGVLYVYWARPGTEGANGATVSLSFSTNAATANTSNTLGLATYGGGTKLNVTLGRTVIDGTMIRTGTITALQADLGSLRAGILVADTITGDMIQANAISARSLILSDYSSLIQNGDFEQLGSIAALWTAGGAAVLSENTTLGAASGTVAAQIDKGVDGAGASSWMETKDFITVGGSETFAWALSARANAASSAGYTVQFRWFTDKLATPTTTNVVDNAALTTTWTPLAGQVTAPSTARYCKIRIFNDATGTNRYTYIDSISLRRPTASLIVEGSITATMLNVSTLSSINSNLGSVTAGEIKLIGSGTASEPVFWLKTDGTLMMNKGSLNIGGGKFVVDELGNVTMKSATTGARLEITNQIIKVFDANNVERVRLGIWEE